MPFNSFLSNLSYPVDLRVPPETIWINHIRVFFKKALLKTFRLVWHNVLFLFPVPHVLVILFSFKALFYTKVRPAGLGMPQSFSNAALHSRQYWSEDLKPMATSCILPEEETCSVGVFLIWDVFIIMRTPFDSWKNASWVTLSAEKSSTPQCGQLHELDPLRLDFQRTNWWLSFCFCLSFLLSSCVS